MKKRKTGVLLGVLLLGFGFPAFAQEVLPEVTVKAVRYKYLSAVDQKDLAQPVKRLQKMAAEYDVKSSDFYVEDNDTYLVTFYIPQGTLLASYDKNGKMLSTVERYKDIALPQAVTMAIHNRFPGWSIPSDVYLVNYFEEKGAIKVYKITLHNGDKRLRIKMKEKGEFI